MDDIHGSTLSIVNFEIPVLNGIMALRAEGNELLRRKDVAGAAALYRRAAEEDAASERHFALSNLSVALFRLEAHEEALEAAQASVKAAKVRGISFAKGFLRLGSALTALGRLDEAEQAFKAATEACKSKSERGFVRTKLEQLEIERKKHDVEEAQQEYEEALHELERARAAEEQERIRKKTQALVMFHVTRLEEGGKNSLVVRWEHTAQFTRTGNDFELPQPADYIGLYAKSEEDPEQYWNAVAEVFDFGRRGRFVMGVPLKDGAYEFRYMTDGENERCAGRSQAIHVKSKLAQLDALDLKPPFSLEVFTRTRCFWLHMPVKKSPEVQQILSKLNLGENLLTSLPSPWLPTMSIENDREVRIYSPSISISGDFHLIPYLVLNLEECVDLCRSSISYEFDGSVLSARLAFKDDSASFRFVEKEERAHLDSIEQDESNFRNGILCRKCTKKISGSLDRILLRTALPWDSVVNHLFCVPPEEYKRGEDNQSLDGHRKVLQSPQPKMALLSKAFIDLDVNDILLPIRGNELFCSCGYWIGFNMGKYSRFYKSSIRTSKECDIFEKYNVTECVVGSKLEEIAFKTPQESLFVVEHEGKMRIMELKMSFPSKTFLLCNEMCIQNSTRPSMHVLYRNIVEKEMLKGHSEHLQLCSEDFEELKRYLEASQRLIKTPTSHDTKFKRTLILW